MKWREEKAWKRKKRKKVPTIRPVVIYDIKCHKKHNFIFAESFPANSQRIFTDGDLVYVVKLTPVSSNSTLFFTNLSITVKFTKRQQEVLRNESSRGWYEEIQVGELNATIYVSCNTNLVWNFNGVDPALRECRRFSIAVQILRRY